MVEILSLFFFYWRLHTIYNRTEKLTAFPIWAFSQLSSHSALSLPVLNNNINARKLAQVHFKTSCKHSAISSTVFCKLVGTVKAELSLKFLVVTIQTQIRKGLGSSRLRFCKTLYSRLQKSCNRHPEQQNQTLHSSLLRLPQSFVFKWFGDQLQDLCNRLYSFSLQLS